ncbi:helix-turn-helix domain-containing protein [Ruegeria sp. 2205SS24-7]|uniref:GlxA family transcriptional regulator n=1 Tax=Ruegeria discodermiae TaxID=3064389 RepID=UPI0027420009|nr:helix-turn-helix domain-containing protein [Ruegeria sp. 2205SS24-7]MDP5217683.1 helix-turn-helix domain-containing protein [Ruegeria sp. 2205SS24-7]
MAGETNQQPRVIHFDVIVADGFVLTEVAGVVDVIRTANRVFPKAQFTWLYRSRRGGPVSCRAGARVETEKTDRNANADYVFVIGNADPDHPDLSLGRIVQDYTYRGAQVFLLAEAATRYIREFGGQSGQHTTHWENSFILRERMEPFDARHALAAQVGQVVTCAGMGSTIDVTLELIGRHMSSAAMMTVSDIFLHERVRDYASPQPYSGIKSTTTGDEKLDQCIKIMQANIEEPIAIHELVGTLGLSNRSLERKFKTFLGATPNGFYREMRLTKANNLLLNTTMSIREIGLACGFPNGFSGIYKSFFGVTPFAIRRRRRSPDHP